MAALAPECRVNLPISIRDLAAGDARSALLDLSRFKIDRIRSVDDPLFEAAYHALAAEFGQPSEVDFRQTLALRFEKAAAMLYEIFLVRRDGVLAAVRDHTAVALEREVVVHLSHNLISAEWRRTGLTGWMRTLPLATARECALAHGLGSDPQITLVLEMDDVPASDPMRLIRLRACEQAGFRTLDPERVRYFPAGFHETPSTTEGDEWQPRAMQLLIRQVGREGEASICGARVRAIAGVLDQSHGARTGAWEQAFFEGGESIQLLAPTQ